MEEQVLGSSRMDLNGGICQCPLKAEFLAGPRSQTEAGGTRGTAPFHRQPDSSRALAAGSPGANKQVALIIQDDMGCWGRAAQGGSTSSKFQAPWNLIPGRS